MVARACLGGALLAVTCVGCNLLLGGPDYKVTSTSGAMGGASGSVTGTGTSGAGTANTTSATNTTGSVAPNGTGVGTTTGASTGPGGPMLMAVQIAAGKETPSGLPQSNHIVYAKGGNRYWFFYVDATPNVIKSRTSTDFIAWGDGPTIAVPYDPAGDSRTFSVAYAHIGNSDVVHIAIALHSGNVREVDYVRGLLTGNTGSFTAAAKVTQMTNNPSGCDPEEPGITIDNGGLAHIISGWWNNATDWCDFNMFDATTADAGQPGFTTTFTGPTHQPISGLTNAHAMIPLGNGVMAFSDSGDVGIPDSSNMNSSAFAGTWPQYAPIYPAGMGAVQSRYDWSVCGKQGGVDVVRRVHNGGLNDQFQYLQYVNGSWTAGAAIPANPGLVNAGIVLLRGPTTLGLFAISADPTSSIHYTLSNGSTWSAWQNLVSGLGMRNHLAGSGCVDTAHPTLIWTQASASANDVYGVPLGSLLP